MNVPELPGEQRRLASLNARLPEERGGLLRWPDVVDSTNARLKEWARQGAPRAA